MTFDNFIKKYNQEINIHHSTKQIQISSNIWEINYGPEIAQAILNEIIKWMEDPEHYAAYSGEGIMQSDNTLINAPLLVSDIVDNILKPKFIKEVQNEQS